MSLAPGTRLGTYEIVALIGAGGMGEVYRARDGTLARDVALKLLPPVFANDPERLARFTREANLLATLNHPNIAAIYGFESSAHSPALVLEMVEGPTLADRLEGGPIPLDEAVPVARQIAEALEAAHAQGIVHRDLKPANVKVRDDGTVKVLDFGLAKAIATDNQSAVIASSPTITSPAATAMGTIMGTAAYMSPEQARGRTVDRRSDIWAFGAVLYEMLTGRRAFDGEDVSDTLANVLKREPDWSALPHGTPSSIERVLRRCLTRDPRRRFHDIADVRIELEAPLAPDASPVPASTPLATRPTIPERVAWIAAVVSLVAVVGALTWRERARAPVARPVVRFQVFPPDKHSFGALGAESGGLVGGAAISPDGTRIVFHAADALGNGDLWVRPLDSFEARKLPNTESGVQPFWSPDSKSIGFFARRKLYKVDLASGERLEICGAAGTPRGGSWGTTGTIIFATSGPPAIMSVPSRGGTPTALVVAGPEGGPATSPPTWPSFLPDGRRFLYLAREKGQAAAAIYLSDAGSPSAGRRLVDSDTQAVFVEPGYLLFGQGTALVRQSFDAQNGRITGDAVPIVDRLRTLGAVGLGEFSASSNGLLTYRSGVDVSTQFTWVDRKGNTLTSVGQPGRYRTSALSPDGTRVVYTDVGDGNLKILDLQSGITTLFTSEPGIETAPVWSSDGATIYYRSDLGGAFAKAVTGLSPPVRILDGIINGPTQFLSHPTRGPLLLFFQGQPFRPSMDIMMLPLTGKREPQAVVSTPFVEAEPQVSPNGKWLAYASGDLGDYEIDVVPFLTDGAKVRVSRSGGRQPYWRADSRELFFVSGKRKFYALKVPDEGPSRAIEPEFLFDMHATVANVRNSYVPSADGSRFLVTTVLDTQDAPIHVVSNWLSAIQ